METLPSPVTDTSGPCSEREPLPCAETSIPWRLKLPVALMPTSPCELIVRPSGPASMEI